jgi:endonuclease/exonuclease/phosphatase family metal-dependent hydrolase
MLLVLLCCAAALLGFAAAEAAGAEPAVAGPVAAGSAIAEPVAAGSAIAEPVAAGSAIAGPVAAGSAIAGPVAAGSAIAGPVAAEPASAEPVDADPADAVGQVLDDWHAAAAAADAERYFGHFTPDGVFMGTDATERWTAAEFREWARPYFERGRAWSFKAVKRHVVVRDGIAWFDEELDTPNLGPCRGTGTLVLDDAGVWRIAHYNLSIPIPNPIADDVVEMVAGRIPAPSTAPLDVEIMSFNIRYGTAKDGPNGWVHRSEMVLDVLRERGPDIVGLQEALQFQLDEIEEALPWFSHVGVGRDDGKTAGEFAAILYDERRFSVAGEGTFWFSSTPDTPGSMSYGNQLPRICTWAKLTDRVTGRSLYVYNLHLDYAAAESRMPSVRQLMERIEADATDAPVVITGDFNMDESAPEVRLITDRPADAALRWVDSYRVLFPDRALSGTFGNFRGNRNHWKVDFVFVPAAAQVVSAEIVHDNMNGRYPSDHFPVTTRLRIE